MSDNFQDRYRIPSSRWQNWDYGWNGAYFVTICTHGREHYFGEIVDGKMVLSNTGIIADILWYEIKKHCNTVELDAFVVMPNHVHGILILTGDQIDRQDFVDWNFDDIIRVNTGAVAVETRHALSLQPSQPSPPQSTPGQQRFQNQGKNTVSSIIGSYKSAVSKHAHRLKINFDWQPRFHDHIIRNDKEYQRISAYIQNNPSNWKGDKFF